ncbi:hypothetical protein ABK040_002742 [Willaertia magna]
MSQVTSSAGSQCSTPTTPSYSNVPFKEPEGIIVLKKSNKGNSSSVVTNTSSDQNKHLCDANTCLEIIERENEKGEDGNACKVCVAKEAATAITLFESIPLSVKLIFIVFFSIISLIVFGAILISQAAFKISTAQYIDKVSHVSLIFSDLIQELQVERSTSIKYSTNRIPYEIVEAQINKTNTAIEAFKKETLSWEKDIKHESETDENNDKHKNNQSPNSQFFFEGASGYIFAMDYYLNNLQAHRNKIRDRVTTATMDILNFYIAWIKNIIDGLIFMSKESKDANFKTTHSSYGYIMRMKEIINVKRSILIYYMHNGNIPKDVNDYYLYAISKFTTIFDEFDITAEKKVRDKYTELIENNVELEDLLQQMENYIFALVPIGGNLNFTDDEIYNNFTIKINNMRSVENFLRQETTTVSDSLKRQAIDALIGYSVSTFVVVTASILIAVFFSRTIIIPWKRLLKAQKDRTKELTTSYTQLNLLLERISAEEQKTRKILNSMEDALVTTNSKGYIMHCNDTFYKMFQFSESDLFNGTPLKIQQVIPSLEITELFEQFNTMDTIIAPDKELKALTKVGKDFPVRVSLNFSRMYLNNLTTKDDTIILSTEKLIQQEQACIILIHNLSDKFGIITEKEPEDLLEFKQMFNNPLKKLDFKEYCKRFKSDENICFLEDVQIYKNTSGLQERSQKQKEIYTLYLKPNAKKPLNISQDQLAIANFRIGKGLGEIELFDSLERIVIENVVHDIYKRWKEHEKSEMQNYI